MQTPVDGRNCVIKCAHNASAATAPMRARAPLAPLARAPLEEEDVEAAAEETVLVPVTEAEAEALALAAATDVTDAMASDERVTPELAHKAVAWLIAVCTSAPVQEDSMQVAREETKDDDEQRHAMSVWLQEPKLAEMRQGRAHVGSEDNWRSINDADAAAARRSGTKEARI